MNTYSVSKNGEESISANFKVKEFRCKDGSDKVLIDTTFVKNKLQAIRDHFGKSVSITSGYRTVSYNQKVSGAKNSYHLQGRAFDIVVKDTALLEVAKYAESIGILGIIVYPASGFVHVDSRISKYFSKDSGKSACTTFGGSVPSGAAVAVPSYKVGKTYTLQTELKVRTGPGTNYAAKTHGQLSTGGQAADKDNDGCLDAGTKVTCQQVQTVGNDIWIKCPSGWLAAYYNGKTYII